MDPNATWATIESHTNSKTIANMAHGQLVELYEAAIDLRNWLRRGGFLPSAALNWTRSGLLNLLDSLVTQVTRHQSVEA